MSEFDRAVLEWVSDADLTKKSKTVVLRRTGAGIESYRRLFANAAHARHFDRITVDPALRQTVERAERRLEDGVSPIVALGSAPPAPAAVRQRDRQLRESTAHRSVSGQFRAASASASSACRTPRHMPGGFSTSASPTTPRCPMPGTARERAALVSKPGARPPSPSSSRRPARPGGASASMNSMLASGSPRHGAAAGTRARTPQGGASPKGKGPAAARLRPEASGASTPRGSKVATPAGGSARASTAGGGQDGVKPSAKVPAFGASGPFGGPAAAMSASSPGLDDDTNTAMARDLEGFSFGDGGGAFTASPRGAAGGSTAAELFGDEEAAAGLQEVATLTEEEDRFRRRSMMTKRMSRQAVSAEVLRPEDVASARFEPIDKPEAAAAAAFATLEHHALFSHFEDATLRQFVELAQPKAFGAGETVILEGDVLDEMLVVVSGALATTSGQEEPQMATAVGIRRAAGAAASPAAFDMLPCAAERALLYESTALSTVDAVGEVEVYAISRHMYKVLSERSSIEKRARYEGFLGGVKFLSGLDRQERLLLADALKTTKHAPGEPLIRYGEPGAWFHIITEGTVEVIGRKDGEKVKVCEFTVGSSVGELEFLMGHDTVADVVAKAPGVVTAKMARNHFEKLIGPARQVLERQAQDDEDFAYYRGKMTQDK